VQELVDTTVTQLIEGMSKLVNDMQDQTNSHKDLDTVEEWLRQQNGTALIANTQGLYNQIQAQEAQAV